MSRQLSLEEEDAVICLLSVRSHRKRPLDKDGCSYSDDVSLCDRIKARVRPSEDNNVKTVVTESSRLCNQYQNLAPAAVNYSVRTKRNPMIKKKMVCVCGAIILVRTEWKHKQSNKHIQFMLRNEAQRNELGNPIPPLQQSPEQQQQNRCQDNKSPYQLESPPQQDQTPNNHGTTTLTTGSLAALDTVYGNGQTTQRQEKAPSSDRTLPFRYPPIIQSDTYNKQDFPFQQWKSVSNGQLQQFNQSVSESLYHRDSFRLSQMLHPSEHGQSELLPQQQQQQRQLRSDLHQSMSLKVMDGTWQGRPRQQQASFGANYRTGTSHEPMYYIVLPQQQQQPSNQWNQWQRIQMGFFDVGN